MREIYFLIFFLIQTIVCYEENTSYRYSYEGKIATGVQSIRSQVSAAGVRCGISLEVSKNGTLLVQFSKFEVGEFNGDVGCDHAASIKIPYKRIENGRNHMEEPFQVFLGQDSPVMAVSEVEDIWVTNIKKSIMQNFAIRPIMDNFRTPKMLAAENSTYFSEKESTIFGHCETENSMIQSSQHGRHGYDSWTLLRTINFDNCSDSVLLQKSSDISLSINGSSQDKSLQSRSSVGQYTLIGKRGDLIMKEFRVEGAVVTSPFGAETHNFQTKSSQFLTLTKVEKHGSIRGKLNIKKRKLEGDWLYSVQSPYEAPKNGSKYPWIHFNEKKPEKFAPFFLETVAQGKNIPHEVSEQLKLAIYELLDRATEDLVAAPKTSGESISLATITDDALSKMEKLTHYIQGMTEADIDSVFSKVFGDTSLNSQLKQSLLVDVAAASGSAASVKVLLDMLPTGKLTEERAASVFITLTNHIFSPIVLETLVRQTERIDFVKKPFLKTAAVVSLSSVMRKLCVDQKSIPRPIFGNQECNERIFKEFEKLVISKASAIRKVWHRNIWLEAATRLGTSKAFETLESILTQSTNATEAALVLTAIKGMNSGTWQHRPELRTKAMKSLFTVIEDTSRDERLRINAAETLVTWKPTYGSWHQLAQLTFADDVSDIFPSFLYFMIKDLAASSNHKFESQISMAQLVLPLCKKFRSNYRYSIEKVRNGYLHHEQISSLAEFSWLPGKFKQLLMKLRANLGGNELDIFDVRFDEFGDDGLLPLEDGPDELQKSKEESYSDLMLSLMKNIETFLPLTFFTVRESIGVGGNQLFRKLREQGSEIHLTKFLVPVSREVFFPSDIGLPIITKISSPMLLLNEGHLRIAQPAINDLTFLKLWNSSHTVIPVKNNFRLLYKLTSKVQVLQPWADSAMVSGIDNVKRLNFPVEGNWTQIIDDSNNRDWCYAASSLHPGKLPVFYGHNIPYTSSEYLWPRGKTGTFKTFRIISMGDDQKPLTQESYAIDNHKTGVTGQLTWRADKKFPFTYGNTLDFLRRPGRILQLLTSPVSKLWQISLVLDVARSTNKIGQFCIYYGSNFQDMVDLNGNPPEKPNPVPNEKWEENFIRFSPSDYYRRPNIEPPGSKGHQHYLFDNKIVALRASSLGQISHGVALVLLYGDTIANATFVFEELVMAATWVSQPKGKDYVAFTTCVDLKKLYPVIENADDLRIALMAEVKSNVSAVITRGDICFYHSTDIVRVEGQMEVSPERRSLLLEDMEARQACDSFDPLDPSVNFSPDAVYDEVTAVAQKFMSNLTTTDEATLYFCQGLIWLYFNPEIERSYAMNHEIRDGTISVSARRPLDSPFWSVLLQENAQSTTLRNVKLPRFVGGVVFHGGFDSVNRTSLTNKVTLNNRLIQTDSEPTFSNESSGCLIGFNKVRNFVGKSYNVSLFSCFTMVARTGDQENGLVLVREQGYKEAQGIQVRIVHSIDYVVDMTLKEVLVNGKEVTISGHLILRDERGALFCTIFKVDGGFVVKIFNGLTVRVNEFTVSVKLLKTEERLVSGLCGIFDEKTPNVGPTGCVYPDNSYQILAYAWTIPVGRLCDLEELWNGKKLVREFQKTCRRVPPQMDRVGRFLTTMDFS